MGGRGLLGRAPDGVAQSGWMMEPRLSEERIRPFRLVKYFTFSSLIVIFIGALVLSFLNTYWARRMLLQKNEEYAHLLIANLNHQVYVQFFLPVAVKYGRIQLSNKDQHDRMDRVVRSTFHSFKVDTVNIYDTESVLSYSYDPTMIGKKNIGGQGYQYALQGRSTSKLIQRGNFVAIVLGFPKESRLITFAPLRQERGLSTESGPVIGVVEIVQDLSEDYKSVFNVQILVILTSSVVMGLLFLVLRFVVKRGEGIIERRALERLELEEQLNRAERLSTLGEMVASVSHEIRNPLGIIKSSAELLKKRMSTIDAGNTMPEIIVEEAGRLNHIITDFLNFARPQTPNLAPCRLDAIVEKNITFLASQIDEGGHSIRKHYPDDIPEIMADADMLYQALLNLLINAMQAMPGGGEISVGISTSDHDTVQIDIEDSGEGISAEVLEKIWDPFFTTKQKGTGLGLGIVKNIIDYHTGSIGIHNSDNGGTRVTIELPARQGA